MSTLLHGFNPGFFRSAVLAAALMVSGHATAQTTTQATEPAVALDEIVVTAQKREQRLKNKQFFGM